MASKSVIGNLQVRITAITSQFTKGMGLATRRTRAFSRLMRTDLSKALPLIAGKLARLGLRGVAAGFRLLTSIARKLVVVLGTTLVLAAGAATVTGEGRVAATTSDGVSSGVATATADGAATVSQPGSSSGISTATGDGVSVVRQPG
ncbi:hypothetical protein LCGC14_2266750, partial [marine sediment metagenome]